ncbi:MAG: type II toxin-antitoxin system VapC family toxin [Acidimicrobiales bacterium]
MTAFLDSSAVVKLYAAEEGSDEVRRIEAIAVCELARVEVPAAMWHKSRMGELEARDLRVLISEFEADWFGTDDELPRFAVVSVTEEILEEAAGLCATHGLRAYDAVQLASALAARRADYSCSEFVAYDLALRQAALREGLDAGL